MRSVQATLTHNPRRGEHCSSAVCRKRHPLQIVCHSERSEESFPRFAQTPLLSPLAQGRQCALVVGELLAAPANNVWACSCPRYVASAIPYIGFFVIPTATKQKAPLSESFSTYIYLFFSINSTRSFMYSGTFSRVIPSATASSP